MRDSAARSQNVRSELPDNTSEHLTVPGYKPMRLAPPFFNVRHPLLKPTALVKGAG